MKRSLFTLLFSFGLAGVLGAEPAPLEQRVVDHTCPNGVRVLILERHFSPTIAVRMIFRVGSVDEVSGRTGLAHMFEHMMFKGTKTMGTRDYAREAPLVAKIDDLHKQLDVEKQKGLKANQDLISRLIDEIRTTEEREGDLVVPNELWNLYEREGGSELNAFTSSDFTEYVIDLPSNKLELWAILDSDRVRNPVFRQFYQEREVVKEERRMRVDTNPDGRITEDFLATAYIAHPYRHPTIGWESDLDHLSVSDLEAFYHEHYTPDHLTIAIVGDVNASQTVEMIDRYFGTWRVPAAGEPPHPPTAEPPQGGMRRVIVQMDAQPQLVVGYHIPTYPDPDHPIYYALSHLLTDGSTSRLYKSLVQKKRLVTSIDSGHDYPGERYDTVFAISGTPRFPHTTDEIEKAIHAELDRLVKEPIQPWELEKVRAGVAMDVLRALQTNDGMAGRLAYDQAIFGDWRHTLTLQKRIESMTAEDLQRVARKTFTTSNETVAVLVPKKS